MKIPFGKSGVSAVAIALVCASPAIATPGNGHPHGQGQGQEHHAQGKTKVHGVTYVFKGTWNSAAGTVTVKHGNAHVRKAKLVGTDVTFDLSSAKFVVRDTNNDGKRDVADLADGDHVVVKARLPRKNPGGQPFKASMLVDQTSPPAGRGD
jgi:hypothetical protein